MGVQLQRFLLDIFLGLSLLTQKEIESLHMEFEVVDEYRTSVPLNHILDKSADILLAFRMNNELLRPDLGYSIQALFPRTVEAWSVK